MRLRYDHYRSLLLNYAAVINLLVEESTRVYRVEELTGDLTFNISDASPRDGDVLILLFQSDASPRVVTIGGPQATPGVVNIPASGTAIVRLFYHGGTGQYGMPVPSI